MKVRIEYSRPAAKDSDPVAESIVECSRYEIEDDIIYFYKDELDEGPFRTVRGWINVEVLDS